LRSLIGDQIRSDQQIERRSGLRGKRQGKDKLADKTLLESEGISHFDKDLRRMKTDELVANFGAVSSGRVLVAKVIKNVIWQAYERISSKAEPPIEGNIRTFWYQWVKPVLAHFSDEDDAKTDPYDTMTDLFARMVLDLKLFRYADFDFTDENWENRRIGTTRPGVLIFAEKTGWIRFLRTLYDEFGVSIIALGGAPSALSSEYTATHIQEALKSNKPIQLIGVVDYDPSGDIIASAFQAQLAASGLASSALTTLIHPKHYTRDEIDTFKFPLPKGERTKLDQWMKKTGGIDGKPYGLESESMPRDRLKSLIRDLIESDSLKKASKKI
jgi:hypothetical protein